MVIGEAFQKHTVSSALRSCTVNEHYRQETLPRMEKVSTVFSYDHYSQSRNSIVIFYPKKQMFKPKIMIQWGENVQIVLGDSWSKTIHYKSATT